MSVRSLYVVPVDWLIAGGNQRACPAEQVNAAVESRDRHLKPRVHSEKSGHSPDGESLVKTYDVWESGARRDRRADHVPGWWHGGE
jgi:hypothetical protein